MKSTRNLAVLSVLWLLTSVFYCSAATFTNNASIRVTDSSNSLTATGTAFTASCWFRISLPSSVNLAANMVILMDRSDGNEAANFSYLIQYNFTSGNVEFSTKGSLIPYTRPLIVRPYLERWYHVAVTRSGGFFNVFVDGQRQQPFDGFSNVGTTTGIGLAIGGISGNTRLFYGEIIEAAIYQRALDQSEIRAAMFADQRTNALITGYYKLSASSDTNDWYRNFVPTPPPGTGSATNLGTGRIDFEETDREGEQSLFDSRRNQGQDAIAPLSGAFSWQQTVLTRPTPGISFDLRIGYSSAMPVLPPGDGSDDPYLKRTLSDGWRHTFDTRVVVENNQLDARLLSWDGAVESWTRTNSVSPFRPRHKEYRGELMFDGLSGDTYWTNADRSVYRFYSLYDPNLAGRLREIHDLNGNQLQVLWNSGLKWVSTVVDSAGGSYQFNYDVARGLLTNVTFGSWRVNFAYDSLTNRLIAKSITNTSGLYANINTTWQFQYATNGLLTRIVDPRVITNLTVQYDRYGRQTNQVDALGRATATRYGAPGQRQITRIDPATNSWIETYDRKGRVLARQDPLTNVTSFTYDELGNRTSVTDARANKTFFAYDDRANVIARTNALNEITRWVMHPFFNKPSQEINPQNWTNYLICDEHGNLTNHSDVLGSLASYTYATNGLVLTSTDGNGHTSRMSYDTNGFLVAATDAATNTTTIARNELGWRTAQINALGEVTDYDYDLNGRVVSVLDPLYRLFTRSYDANGNLLSASDGKGQFTTYAYDLANQRTNMVDRTGSNVWRFTYTLQGDRERIINPLTYSVTNFYDNARRLIRIADPLGNTITNFYDGNGNRTNLVDSAGQSWKRVYDPLNRVIAETDPLGNSSQITYDNVGRVKTNTTPRGFATTHDYDGRGRLVKWVDAEASQWLYAYDAALNITNITDALGGHYDMEYGPRNERTLERNQDNKEWHYAYDELGRLRQQTDPNGTIRDLEYDEGGRLSLVSFSTGRSDDYFYDDNNNLESLSRYADGVATFTHLHYDDLDRVADSTDTFGKRVRYGYDPLGRVTALTYPDGKVLQQRYDPIGRLTNQVDWAGREMKYAYDRTSRLVSRTYPNGITQTNVFDSANRLTNLVYRTGGTNMLMALAFAYDQNGNKTSIEEQGTLDWTSPALTDEAATFTASGRLTNRQISTNSSLQSSISYTYDPSGNMTNATGGGQSWTLAYDEDSRTTSIHWQAGVTNRTIVNRYDALGRRVARIVNGVETRYVLSLQGSMERILCDVNAAGNISAWYVHGTPDLCYKVDATNGLTCFHADAQANIIALTDGNTNIVAQYGYTPYGRSLVSSNGPSAIGNQPFTFVGSQGVMEELPGLYFMRARYYSAEAAVFFSTDPVKHIGPGWKPDAFAYAGGNPGGRIDPNGEFWGFIGAVGLGALGGAASETGSQALDLALAGEDPFDRGNYDGAGIAGAAVEGAIGAGLMTLKAPEPIARGVAAAGGELTRELVAGEDVDWRRVGETGVVRAFGPNVAAFAGGVASAWNHDTSYTYSPTAEASFEIGGNITTGRFYASGTVGAVSLRRDLNVDWRSAGNSLAAGTVPQLARSIATVGAFLSTATRNISHPSSGVVRYQVPNVTNQVLQTASRIGTALVNNRTVSSTIQRISNSVSSFGRSVGAAFGGFFGGGGGGGGWW